MIRKGSAKNVMVNPLNDFDNDAFGWSDGKYTFTHKAYGADMFRYSWNFGKNWTTWQNWEDTTSIDASVFDDDNKENFWEGQHIMVQCTCLLSVLLTMPLFTCL